ncbi:MAG TPA: hypothetical protein VGF48_00375 [Thermoanaerobaculia bacterium]|jgi:hypothetical protein
MDTDLEAPPDNGARRHRRPPVHTERWGKVDVVVFERHIAYLDIMSILIRLRHRKAIPRAEIVRAFVEFMERSGIDFTEFRSGDEIAAHLVNHFGRIRPAAGPLAPEWRALVATFAGGDDTTAIDACSASARGTEKTSRQ